MPEHTLLGARRLRELLERYQVRPRRSLGQNFVLDPNTIRKVVSVAGIEPGDRVLEIGAGAGSLTLALAAAAKEVVAVEVDRRLVALLDEVLEGAGNVTVVQADALTLPLARIAADRVVANLPYNIAASVVLTVLQQAPSVRSLTVMAQREVGERLSAPPGSKVYGGTSVLVAFFGRAHLAGTVSRNAFYPVPNVDSAIVHIERRPEPPDVDPEVFFRVVKAAFGQRRKTLRNTLAGTTTSRQALEEALEAAGVDPSVRAEDLGVEAFVEVARRLGRAP